MASVVHGVLGRCHTPDWVQFADTARGLGVEILVIRVDGPDGFDDFFAAARRAGADAMTVALLP
jgi:hypothetical protein